MNNIERINDYFKLPIYYNQHKVILQDNIINDLELIETIDASCKPIYHYYLNNDEQNELSRQIIKQISGYYTTDVPFIKDNQKLLKELHITPISDYTKIIDTWNSIKNDDVFKERYYYVEWEMLEHLNNSSLFLQMMSFYNIISPLISLLIPIIILIIPFVVIKLRGQDITLDEYINILKNIVQHNAIGKLFTNFNSVALQDKAYLIISAAFYIFSIYQNFLVCYKFNQNMIKIHNYFNEIRDYLYNTISRIQNYLDFSTLLKTHNEFNIHVRNELNNLKELYTKTQQISKFKYSIQKASEIGHILKTFYEIYNNKTYENSIMYSFGFNGYIDCIIGLQQNINDKHVNFARFTNKKNKSTFKQNYYACLKDKSPVTNNIKLDKNMIISGPNASGKTTIIKSVLVNIILTQQFGCGFYKNASIKPYHYLHCYLNIPDTSGRDSLFQAEARRCKEIIDIINQYPYVSHFCSFDELYSGTNPEEATISATAFMEYIVKNKNVQSILTTHFLNVCKNLDKNIKIKNYYMDSNKKENMIEYFYKLKEGISNVKGGINILYEMNYPKEIINNTIQQINYI